MGRYFLLTDLEGPAGVYKWTQTREEGPAKEQAMHLLAGEVNACVEGILAADPGAYIVVWDGHGSGGLYPEELHPDALYLPGTYGRPYLLPEGFDGLFFVGQHAMAGTPEGPLCHTYSSRHVEYYKLNGALIGEFGCRAALAGDYAIPTVFLSGDDKAAEEARTLVPGIITAATKRGLGLQSALHLSPVKARELIRTSAAEAVVRIGTISPYVVPGPYEFEMRFLDEEQAARTHANLGGERKDSRSVVLRKERLADLPI